jgi:uncharacterized protein YukE
MTTIHLQTENGHQTASMLKQNGAVCLEEVQGLQRALQNLEMSWQGNAQIEFTAQANSLVRQLLAQIDALQMLAEKLEREVIEWEETDRRGGQSFPMSGSALFLGISPPIFSGGANGITWPATGVVPLFAGLSVGSLWQGVPAWLRSFLDRFYTPAEIVSPIAEGPAVPQTAPGKSFGDLIKEMPQAGPTASTEAKPAATVSAEPSVLPSSEYDIYYDIPAKSQGNLYGNAACLPTSLSMVTDYFHGKDSSNPSVSPEGLKNMLDPGDGTYGVGVKLDKLNDDLAELGYKNVKNFQSDMDGLKKALADGPVVANVGVKLVSNPARGLDGPGAVNHSVVVRGVSSTGVLINDPWSGSEMKLTNEQFSAMWGRGEHWIQTVRP